MKSFISLAAALLVGAASAGTVIWDGRFNEFTSSADLTNWSWANQVGPYQYYIHGSGPVTDYVNLSPSYKNPADSVSKQGVKITVNPTALWNSDMWRTELIPQTSANLGTGRLYYHFSMKKSGTNPPNPNYEHQVNFFESHFTEMKYGSVNGNQDNNLRWFVGGQSKWNVDWVADVWHNFAYDINFSAGTVALWHSTGSSPLTQVVAPISASTSTNSADWHLGVLRLPNRSGGTNDPAAEDWYFSGVYVESGSITTAIGNGPVSPPVSSSTHTSTTTYTPIPTSTLSPPVSSSTHTSTTKLPTYTPIPTSTISPLVSSSTHTSTTKLPTYTPIPTFSPPVSSSSLTSTTKQPTYTPISTTKQPTYTPISTTKQPTYTPISPSTTTSSTTTSSTSASTTPTGTAGKKYAQCGRKARRRVLRAPLARG